MASKIEFTEEDRNRVLEILSEFDVSEEQLEELTNLVEGKRATGLSRHQYQTFRMAVDGLRSVYAINSYFKPSDSDKD